MVTLRFVSSLGLVAVSLVVGACGGSVEETAGPTSTTSTAPPSHASTAGGVDQPVETTTTAPAKPRPTACQAQPRTSSRGLDSCDVARESMTLEITGLTWADPALAWKEGGRAGLEIRYQNASELDAIQYPGVVVASSDARAQTDTDAHGDSFVHPDLYALSSCMVYDSHDHGFTLLSAVPSGTKLMFTVGAAVADGNGISSCGGTLPTATASFIAP